MSANEKGNEMNFFIEKSTKNDLYAIYDIMKQWNMHHIPSPEMEKIDISCFFIAKLKTGEIVGAAGYKIIDEERAKTTLLGVKPEYLGFGIGKALQIKRMEAVYFDEGRSFLTTNADRAEVIVWYKKHFGYKEIGKLSKKCAFGLVSEKWTTLQTNLDDFFENLASRENKVRGYIRKNDAHPLAPFDPLVINVCLTGMQPQKLHNEYIPISPEEIIEDGIAVCDEGATVLHLHARDKKGNPTPDARVYEKIIIGIREEYPNVICSVTTSGRLWADDFEKRAEVLELSEDAKPDMASLTLGSMNFLRQPSLNSLDMIQRLAFRMKERGIKPELEVFDSGMLHYAKYLERNRIIGGRKYFNFLLGNINTAQATIGDMAHLVGNLPQNSIWAGAGLGKFQLPVNVMAIAAGGHVRVGIEDSIFGDYAEKTPWSNRKLVKRVVRISHELQRPVASIVQTRRMLGLGV